MWMLFFFVGITTNLLAQGKLERHVVQKHADGTPYVVVHINPASGEIEKEEVFYPTGKPEWIGHYKGKKEHGKWTYFWPNGNVKSEELYSRGKEEGISVEYNEKGEKVKEILYRKGIVISEKPFSP
jgi:hypothetical protein